MFQWWFHFVVILLTSKLSAEHLTAEINVGSAREKYAEKEARKRKFASK
jgi:hypothetical protein